MSVGAPGSGTELVANRVLTAAGLDPRKDITRHTLGVAESVGALKDGKLDAFIWSGGLPTPSVQDLAATPGLSMALLAHDSLLPFLQRDYGQGLYSLAMIPGRHLSRRRYGHCYRWRQKPSGRVVVTGRRAGGADREGAVRKQGRACRCAS